MNIRYSLVMLIMLSGGLLYADGSYTHDRPHIKFKNKTGKLIKVTLNNKVFEMAPNERRVHELGYLSGRNSQTNPMLYTVKEIKVDAMGKWNWEPLLSRSGLDLKIDGQHMNGNEMRYKAWRVEITPESIAVAPYSKMLSRLSNPFKS